MIAPPGQNRWKPVNTPEITTVSRPRQPFVPAAPPPFAPPGSFAPPAYAAGQPGPGPQPGQPLGAPPGQGSGPRAAPPAPGRRRRTDQRLLTVVLVLGVTVLVAGLGTAALLLLQGGPPGAGTARARAVVEDYLAALGNADADAALALLSEPPADRTFLTRPVLEASGALAPLTDVQVGTPTADNEVPVSYRLGPQQVATSYSVQQGPDGAWKVTDGLASAQVIRPKVPVRLNGVELHDGTVEIFPGSYQLSTGLPYLAYTEDTFTVTDPAASAQVTPRAALTAEGRAAFLRATRTALTKCLAQQAMAPAGCPQSAALPAGNTPQPETIEWKLAKEPDWESLQPELSVADESRAEVSLPLELTISLKVDTGRGIATIDRTPLNLTAKVRAPMTQETVQVAFTK
ncbi:hypothetical protein [Granulicoccus phenolivorans]|uniref:hypothetical protein n=1 Tax=Granulicoccus phenolivorans TaxID=266854 RepID=UPI0011AE6370|nr:hypothetical protein [Granulicoccus phenolivorans]